jgi:hypothetical protein
VIATSIGLVAACGGDDGGEASLDEFCEFARQADAAGNEMTTALESQDPEEIERVFNAAVEDFEAAADAAPEAIADVAAEVTETAQELRDRFEELDWDVVALSEDDDALELAAQSEEANTELDEFLERECGIPADTEAPDATDVPSTESGDAAGGDDPATVAGLLGTAIAEELGVDLDDEARTCIGEALVDGLGVDAIVEAGASGSGLAGFDEEQQAVILDSVEECIPTDALVDAFIASGGIPEGVTEEQARCLFEGALDEFGFAAMASSPAASPEQEEAFREIAEECGIDPALLDG